MQRSESEAAGTGFVEPRTGVRALFFVLFGLTLAVLWVVFGTSHSASAEEAPPSAPAAQPASPSLLGSVASTVDSVVAVVAPQQPAIVTPVVHAVTQSVTALTSAAPQPVTAVVTPLTHAVDTVVATVPVVAQITGPAPITAITAPVTSTVDGVVDPLLTPVLTDVVGPVLTPIAGPVLGPVLGTTVDTSELTSGGLLGHLGAAAVAPEPADRGMSDLSGTWSGSLLPRFAAASSSPSRESTYGTPIAPSTPASPLGVPTDRAVGMLSGSSSAGSAGGGSASAGLLSAFGLPARAVLDSAATPADDSLPTSLTVDPGSSPD